MKDPKVIAIDLAKNIFEVCVVDGKGRVVSQKVLRRNQLSTYLCRQPRALVAMEACSGAHHWGRRVQEWGHQAVILPPRRVSPYRQGQKTDANDALAIAIAARQPKLKTVGVKTLEQQSLQSDKRVQEHLSDQLTATGNLIRAVLAEFGVVVGKGRAALRRSMPEVLEDADNGLPLSTRESLNLAWRQWRNLAEALQSSERILSSRVKDLEPCRRLLALEGVAEKNAIGLYVAIGRGDQFKNGRETSACIGLTPTQYSSGGKVRMKGIGKFKGQQRLRSSLIIGARAFINTLSRGDPRTDKERWLKALINRRGPGRAAVALAHKNVRTAWAMLRDNTAYQA